MQRIVEFDAGRLFVVADLHGEWGPYAAYRDAFLAHHARGEADAFVLLGDVIHGYREPEDDASVEILLDVMRLQAELGHDRVVMLLGNHEMAHLYYMPLAKGAQVFTPRFEHALGDDRAAIMRFLDGLPFMARTAGGVLLVHAGASARAADPEHAAALASWSHRALFAGVDALLDRRDVQSLLEQYAVISGAAYDEQAWELLAVAAPEDPRYLDLLRGFVANNLEPEWPLLWDFFFTQCEDEFGRRYRDVVQAFLAAYVGEGAVPRVLVSGHMVVRGCHALPTPQHLRLASWSHARPHEAGCALLLDAAQPVTRAADLVEGLLPLAEIAG